MKKKIWQCSLFLLTLFLFSPLLLTAQNFKKGNSKIINFNNSSTRLKATEANILNHLKLDQSFDLKLKNEYRQGLSKRYQLQYDGKDVKHMHLIAHNKSDHLSRLIVNEKLNDIYISESTVSITGDEAVEIFGNKIINKKPVLKKGRSGPKIDQVYYPIAKQSNHYVLCYEIYLIVEEKPFQYVGYVDASNGRIIEFLEAAMTCNSPGTATTVFSGNQNITTNEVAPNDFTLEDCSRGSGLHTRHAFNHYNSNAAIDYHDDDNNWDANSGNNSLDQYALDAHWGTQLAYDYFEGNYNVDITHGDELGSFLTTGYFLLV